MFLKTLFKIVNNFIQKMRTRPSNNEPTSVVVVSHHNKQLKDKKSKKLCFPSLSDLQSIISYRQVQRVGPYNLGPEQGSLPVKCQKQYLARKGDNFFTVKILTLPDDGVILTTDDIQGQTLIDTEHSLLVLLKDQPNIIQCVDFFRETIQQKILNETTQKMEEKTIKRICLVLECQFGHDFSPVYTNITNLQRYVVEKKKLLHPEALQIFYKILKIVQVLHDKNIVHRDLKLGNVFYNKKTSEVKLYNFCLGKQLDGEDEPLKDQRGSPAYISPDVIKGKPYLGKPSDMWALGVVLYTMLFGQFPFYDIKPTELFKKIKSGQFVVPTDANVDNKTIALLHGLICLNPTKRLTISKAIEKVEDIIFDGISLMSGDTSQQVPIVEFSNLKI